MEKLKVKLLMEKLKVKNNSSLSGIKKRDARYV